MIEINNISQLHNIDYNLHNISGYVHNFADNGTYYSDGPRTKNAFMLFCGASAVYNDYKTGKSIPVPCHSMFFIPEDAEYSWSYSNKNPDADSALLFGFSLKSASGIPIRIKSSACIVNISDYTHYKDLFSIFTTEYKKPSFSYSKIKSLSFSIMSDIIGENKKTLINNHKLSTIYNGIKYLDEDSKQEKSIEEIAHMCNISATYFERLFKEYSGETPSKYRLNKKIARAKLLLADDILNIKQVSIESGFEDYAYFCKTFKKICGLTPTEYRNKKRNVFLSQE